MRPAEAPSFLSSAIACEPVPSFRERTAANDDPWRYSVPLWCALWLLAGTAASGATQSELLHRLGVPEAHADDDQWPVAMPRFAAVLRWASRRTRDELIGLWPRPAPPGSFATV